MTSGYKECTLPCPVGWTAPPVPKGDALQVIQPILVLFTRKTQASLGCGSHDSTPTHSRAWLDNKITEWLKGLTILWHLLGIAAMKVTLMIILSSIATSLALISPFSTRYQLDDDYVVQDYHNVSIPFSNFSYKGIVSSTNRSYTAFVAVLPSGISNQFSFELPKGKLR